MNKIETGFNKLKRYEDIETYYPPLEDIKDFLYELFEDRVESQKYIVRANKQIDQLTNNWNELEEWLKEYIDKNDKWYNNELSNHDKQYYGDTYYNTNYMLEKFLDKMKEIKEGNNE